MFINIPLIFFFRPGYYYVMWCCCLGVLAWLIGMESEEQEGRHGQFRPGQKQRQAPIIFINIKLCVTFDGNKVLDFR